MEVASPLSFGAPTGAGSKRSLACSPEVLGTPSRSALTEMCVEDSLHRSAKRRRCGDAAVESLSNAFSSHSPFFQHNHLGTLGSTGHHVLKRSRAEGSSPVRDLSPVVEEQSKQIASLKKDKTDMESENSHLKSDNGRLTKENQLLRRAVAIQQDRQTQAENDLKAAHEYRAGAEERIRKLEQLILSLRYHLSQQNPIGNNFLEQRPPDVY